MEPEWVQACLAALDRFANDPELVQLATSGAGEWLSLGEAAARGELPQNLPQNLLLQSALGSCDILGSGH